MRQIRPGTQASPDHSRVIEVNPSTNEIEWEYKEKNHVDFFSDIASSAQRLPNGNTLICEATYGRFFEVTPSGEIVWEYINPFYGSEIEGYFLRHSNICHRCHRYGPDYPGLQGKSLDPGKLEAWNRLYSSPVTTAWATPPGTGIGTTPPAEAKAPAEGTVHRAQRKETRPSARKQGKKEEERLKYLGY